MLENLMANSTQKPNELPVTVLDLAADQQARRAPPLEAIAPTKSRSVTSKVTRQALALVVAGLSLALTPVVGQAVTINFDDIPRIPGSGGPDPGAFYYHPLTDEYLSRGLRIEGGFLVEYGSDYPSPISLPNLLLGSAPQLRLDFVGALPTFVSMYVSSVNRDAIFINAYGPGGVLSQVISGYGGPIDTTPSVPNQFITFSSSSGFTSITLYDYWNLRVNATVDDLTYLYAPVSEPSSLALLGLGLLGLAWRAPRRDKHVNLERFQAGLI
jgi:hypothetical protein